MTAQTPAQLLPHAEPMVLLDRILEWDDAMIKCSALSHRNPNNPLRDNGRLSVYCGVEYAAQAMAAHNRLTAPDGARPQEGFIATASKLEAGVATLDACAEVLIIAATRIASGGDTSLYGFSIEAGRETLLTGQLMVVKQR